MNKVSEYSIVDFLEALTDDDLQKKLIKLVSEGYSGEKLLEQILKQMGGK